MSLSTVSQFFCRWCERFLPVDQWAYRSKSGWHFCRTCAEKPDARKVM